MVSYFYQLPKSRRLCGEVNENAARIWLIVSTLFISGFIIFIFKSFNNQSFSITTELVSKTNGIASTKEVFNYPLLITRLLLISLFLYIVSFSLRQYSINRHLQTINQHRKNALNSFLLFESTIDKADPSLKNALVLQLSKAIFEESPTGFLNSKYSEPSGNQFVEMTKVFSEIKK